MSHPLRNVGAMADDRTPKVTPHLLQRALDMCPRRLAHEFECRDADANPFTRWRLRSPFVAAAAIAHRPGAPAPSAADFPAPAELVHEEVAAWERATATYLARFGHLPATTIEHGCEQATHSEQFGVRAGGAVDLLVAVDDDVRVELRQFELWGRPLAADPAAGNWEIGLAVLRLAARLAGRRLRVCHVDLLRGEADVAVVDYDTDLAPLREAFARRLDELRARAATGEAIAGTGCGQCHHVAGCPAHGREVA